MTLAFIESPIALIALFVIILICFGPNKVPEIANQIGRALGEFRRATSSFQQSMRLDDHDNNYHPTSYDSYGNPSDYSASSSVPEEDLSHTAYGAYGESSDTSSEPPRGDFAASALADAGDDYGVAPSPARATGGSASVSHTEAASREITPRPAESTVPRNG